MEVSCHGVLPACGVLSVAVPILYLTCAVFKIPFIWQQWYPQADEKRRKSTAFKAWQRRERERQARLHHGQPNAGDENPEPEPLPRMHEDDADNFLHLAAALKIILAHAVRDDEIGRAKELLYAYLQGFLRVRLLLFTPALALAHAYSALANPLHSLPEHESH